MMPRSREKINGFHFLPVRLEVGMSEEIYRDRREWLERLPACFSVGEFRSAAGVSPDVAGQTCRRLAQARVLSPAGRGVYRQADVPLALPLPFHLALAGGVEGYFTGRGALACFSRRRAAAPAVLDLVTSRRLRPLARLGEGELRRHRLELAHFSHGLIVLEDGRRRFAIATPERVILDSLACPGRFLTTGEILERFRRRNRGLRPLALLDLVARYRSETVRRRLGVLAFLSGMRRLEKWLVQEGEYSPRMGLIWLDRGLPGKQVYTVRFGVKVNLPPGR